MPESYTYIIQPDKYVETPIRDLIEKISSPDHKPTDEEIASLIVKYLHRYCVDTDEEGDLLEISKGMKIFEYFFAHARMEDFGVRFDITSLPDFLKDFFEFAREHDYALSMLGDVSTTTAIVKSIISQTVGTSPDGNFIGLDIGTGSGILALAQYILARRNGFNRVKVFGIEQHEPASEASGKFLNGLVPGGVFEISTADSTHPSAYANVPRLPDHLSIEMIPQFGGPVNILPQMKSGKTFDADPFFPSLYAFCNRFSGDPSLIETPSFPSGIRADTYFSNPKDAPGLCDFPMHGKGAILDTCLGGAEKVASNISAMVMRGIQLSPEKPYTKLTSIGSQWLKTPRNPNGFIGLFPAWSYRWKQLYHLNPNYFSILKKHIKTPAKIKSKELIPMLDFNLFV